jgi:hypothetical protein
LVWLVGIHHLPKIVENALSFPEIWVHAIYIMIQFT